MQRLSELWLDILFGLLLTFLTTQAADSLHQTNQISPVGSQSSVLEVNTNYFQEVI